MASKREVAELACRILALSILALSVFQVIVMPVQIVMGLYGLMHGYGPRLPGYSMLGSSVSAVLHLALVCFLWTRSSWIASKIVPHEASDWQWPRLRIADLQVAAFSTVGVITLVNSVGYFCRSLGIYFDSLSSPILPGSPLSFFSLLALEWTLASLAYAAVGFWLLVGSHRIVRFVRRLQQFGYRGSGGEDRPAPAPTSEAAGTPTDR